MVFFQHHIHRFLALVKRILEKIGFKKKGVTCSLLHLPDIRTIRRNLVSNIHRSSKPNQKRKSGFSFEATIRLQPKCFVKNNQTIKQETKKKQNKQY